MWLAARTQWGEDSTSKLEQKEIILVCRKITIFLQLNFQRPVCKLHFVHCGLVEKTKGIYLSQFKLCGVTKFENTVFQIAKLRFTKISPNINKILRLKIISGDTLKARGLLSLTVKLEQKVSVDL